MGGRNSRQKKLKKKELTTLIEHTHFTQKEVESLFAHFKKISGSQVADNLIDVQEFQEALGLADPEFARRIFCAFDNNQDAAINFREFALGLSVLCPRGTPEEKLRFSFQIYDVDGDGHIDKQELYSMLAASLVDYKMVEITEEQMREIVDATFAEVDTNDDGKISYEEYRVMMQQHPNIAAHLTINVSELIL